MYKSNTISSLDRDAQDKIVQVFTTTQNIALGLVIATGENRSKLLQQLERVQEDLDLNTSFAIAQNKYVTERGDTAFENLKLGTQMFLGSLNTLLPNHEVTDEIEKAFKQAAHDLNYDQTIINNLSPELVQMLNEAGPNVLQTFVKAADNVLAGNTTQEQALVDVSGFVGLLSDRFDDGIRRNASMDPITESTAKLLTQQKFANDSAKNTLHLADMQKIIDENKKGVDASPGAIKAVDDAAIASTTTLEAYQSVLIQWMLH